MIDFTQFDSLISMMNYFNSETERFENMFAKSIGLVVTWDGLKLCQAA